jgi:hypothetical protein
VSCTRITDNWSLKILFARISGNPVLSCLNPTTLWLAQAGINLATDVMIFVLPMPHLLALQLPLKKKAGLVAIFSVGIMAIVASCVRIWIISLWASTPINQTKFAGDMMAWGQVEVNSGIISASIPFLRPLVRPPKKADKTRKGKETARRIHGEDAERPKHEPEGESLSTRDTIAGMSEDK